MKKNKHSSFTIHHSSLRNVPELRFPEFKNSGEWEVKKLGEVAEITTGSSNREDSTAEKGKYTFFDRSEDVRTSDRYLFDGEAIIVGGEGQKFIPKYFIGKFDLHQRAYAIMNFRDNTSGRFLFYSIYRNRSYFLRYAVGSTVKSLRLPIFEKMPVLLPIQKEQQKIAAFLSNLDALIDAHKQKLELLKQHKKGLMQNLFPQENGELSMVNGELLMVNEKNGELLMVNGELKDNNSQFIIHHSSLKRVPKWRFPEFKDDGEWVEKKLGEVGDFTGGGADKKIKENEKLVMLLNYMDVYKNNFIYKEDLKQQTSATIEKIEKCNIKKGDIFFTPTSEVPDDIAQSAVAVEDIPNGVYSYHLIRLRLKENWDLKFRTYIFKTNNFFETVSKLAQGSGTRYVITMPVFNSLKVPIPTLPEQQKIAECLSSLDELIAAQAEKIEQLERHKKGLMQKMFPEIN